MALMISVSGIRGIFGKDLTPENLSRFTAAYGTWLKGGTVVLGRDSRTTGELCERIVTAALQAVGCDVIRLGIVPTPTVAMGVLRHNADGGIIISASHNPAQWNALKLLNSKSEFLDAEQGKEVIRIAEENEVSYVAHDAIGNVSEDSDILDYHIEKILELPYIDAEKIKAADFTVALDAVNGAGSVALPRLMEKLGVSTINKLYCEPNGLFPHNPEPLPEHLTEICQTVTDTKSDIGFVTDPDADRLAVVDENGKLFGEEYTLAAALDFTLQKIKGDVAVNLSSSRVSEDIAKKYGVNCHRAAVGEINVVKKMQEKEAIMGGEGNGGVINPDLHYGRDALVGVAMILQLLAENGQKASEYRASLPHYVISKNKMQLDGSIDAESVLKDAARHFAQERISTIDGVKIDFDDGWVHLRKSNTEPIIRIYSEAKSEKEANRLAGIILNLFNK